jgi:uncharacterized membrane protein
MNTRIHYAIQVAFIVVTIALIALFWNNIPATVPVHYNLAGEANGYGSKSTIMLFPASMLFINLLIYFLPYIYPKKHSPEHLPAYRSLALILNGFFFVMFVYLLMGWLGHAPEGRSWVPFICILLMLALGNFFSKLKPNYFIGIRVPWTLENETVWIKTHRMAAYLWVIASLIMAALYFVLPDKLATGIFLAYLAVIIVAPVVYSFVVFRKLQQSK